MARSSTPARPLSSPERLVYTCINYQRVLPPVRGEHLAFGDTGSVIYADGVFGARSNYEGGPAALAAELTGRTARYGFHLDARRRGDRRYRLTDPPRSLSDGGCHRSGQESYWQAAIRPLLAVAVIA